MIVKRKRKTKTKQRKIKYNAKHTEKGEERKLLWDTTAHTTATTPLNECRCKAKRLAHIPMRDVMMVMANGCAEFQCINFAFADTTYTIYSPHTLIHSQNDQHVFNFICLCAHTTFILFRSLFRVRLADSDHSISMCALLPIHINLLADRHIWDNFGACIRFLYDSTLIEFVFSHLSYILFLLGLRNSFTFVAFYFSLFHSFRFTFFLSHLFINGNFAAYSAFDRRLKNVQQPRKKGEQKEWFNTQ